MIIPEELDNSELLARCIVYSFSANEKGDPKPCAFDPPWDSDETSTLRENYCDIDFIHKHGKIMEEEKIRQGSSNSSYKCSVFVSAKSIRSICKEIDRREYKLNVIATPLDAENKKRNFPVFKKDEGLPMHADIIFPVAKIKGKTNPLIRQFSVLLVQSIVKKEIFPVDN